MPVRPFRISFDLCDRTHLHGTPSGEQGVANSLVPEDVAPVGKSGALMNLVRVGGGGIRGDRSCGVLRRSPHRGCAEEYSSPFPTAMPVDPFTRRLGNRAGSTVGSWRSPE